MKFRTLSSAALVAALAVGVLSPITASAVATSLDSTGTVIITEGTTGGIDTPTVDPENPAEVLPKPDVPETETTNPDQGPMAIEKTTNLDFGTVSTSATDVTAFAKAMEFNSGQTKRGAYVQWADVRAGGTFGYTVTAELAQQFTGKSANKLNAATIDFTKGIAVAAASNTNTVPSDVKTAFQLNEADGAVNVVTADQAKGEGKGRYTMEFGQSNDPAGDSSATAVKLTIPAATASNMAVDSYTAKVTWKIVAAPAPAPAP